MTFSSRKNNSDSVIKINYNVESGVFFTFAVRFVNQQTGVISSAEKERNDKDSGFFGGRI
jgi:hypothetical protein